MSCLSLKNSGIPSVIVERALAPTRHPQAHFINNRTMEVFRQMGSGLADEVRRSAEVHEGKKNGGPCLIASHCFQVVALSPPLVEWRRFVYCRSLSGQVLGQVDHFEGVLGSKHSLIM